MILDRDLQSIQDVRNIMVKAKQASKDMQNLSQDKINSIVKIIAEVCVENTEKLAKMAVEETGFGIWEDKVLKNLLGSKMLYDHIKDMKTIGIINDDKENKIIEIAVPVGVVAGIIPSTNPTSTTMFKALISLKSGNSIVISPHPNAKKCTLETVKIMCEAAKKAGAPDNVIQCIEIATIEATNELMKHKDTGVILATGGPGMVKAAYSSGNPAIGVGAGNGPAYIEKSANIKQAIKRIIDSKTFDNGTICASEQSIVTEKCIKDEVIKELLSQGGYILTKEESEKLAKIIMRSNNTMNPVIVGKSVQIIAKMADIEVPHSTKVLVSMESEVGHNYPYSREKLCPILGFYTEENWEMACEKCIEILENEGVGHTMTIHSGNEDIIKEFALKKPIGRLLVNTPAALGGVGATTNLSPSLTLGCGSMGGSSTFDNVGPMNLINIRRVAYGTKEIEDLREDDKQINIQNQVINALDGIQESNLNVGDLEKIIESVLKNILV